MVLASGSQSLQPAAVDKAPKKRSKKGCLNCLASKVKCSETQPACARCVRLRTVCEWRKPFPTLRERRYGYGPLKHRTSFAPARIEVREESVPGRDSTPPPKSSLSPRQCSSQEVQPGVPTSLLSTAFDDTYTEPIYINTLPVILPVDPTSGEDSETTLRSDNQQYWTIAHFASSPIPCFQSNQGNEDHTEKRCNSSKPPPGYASSETEELLVAAQLIPTKKIPFAPESALVADRTSCHTFDRCQPKVKINAPDVGSFSPVSPVSFTGPERHALYHYQNVLAKTYSPKTWSYSTLDAICRLGKGNLTIMHLILAGSLAQLSRSGSDQSLWACGELHYQLASQRLMSRLDNLLMDHCITMTAFWLLQFIFGTIWGEEGTTKMSRLSGAVANYAWKHDLLELFRSSNLQHTRNIPELGLMTRLMVWFFYADVEAEFYNAAGEYATFFCSDMDVARDIYRASETSLEIFYNTEYPPVEVEDDHVKRPFLRLRFEITLLLHEINSSVSQKATFDRFLELEKVLEQLGAKIQIAADIAPSVTGRVRELIGFLETFYHATHIYNTRCMLSSLTTSKLKEHRQSHVRALLEHAHRETLSRPASVNTWIQWPLFMAGIETSEAAESDWITNQLNGCKLSHVLSNILSLQASSPDLPIEVIRDMCSRPL